MKVVNASTLSLVAAGVVAITYQGPSPMVLREFPEAVVLDQASGPSANVSIGDLDGDGDLDIVLAKGRHDPYVDKVLLNDGKGHFVTSDLGSTADRTYTAALADLDGDGDLDVVISNDAPDKKLLYLNDG